MNRPATVGLGACAASLAARPASRQNNIGALRLGLAFLVLLSHAPELIDGNRSRELLTRAFHTLSFGEFAVDGFFILSGALITASFFGSKSPVAYLRKRILRIYPGYVVGFLFCVFLVAPTVGGTLDVQNPRFWLSLVKRCLLLETPYVPGALAGNPEPSLNGSMWTVGYEFAAYLGVLLLGTLGMLRRRRFVLGSAVALIVVDSLWHSRAFAGWRDALATTAFMVDNLIRFMGLFASGASFHLYRDSVVYRGRWAAVAALVFVLSLLSERTAHLGMATVGAYLLFFAAWHVGSQRLARIGAKNDLSYGFYLYAWPVQSVLVWHAPTISPWVLLVESACLTAVLASLSWIAVERPALRLKRALGPVTATGGVTAAELA